MNQPEDRVVSIRMRKETENVTTNETPKAATGPEATAFQLPVPDGAAVFMPLIIEEARAKQAKARIWNCLSFLMVLVTALAVVPLVLAFIRLGQWLYGL